MRIATELDADALIILTDVGAVAETFDDPVDKKEMLGIVTPQQLASYVFCPGNPNCTHPLKKV